MSEDRLRAALPKTAPRAGQSLSDHITVQIRVALASGRLRPGERLSADGVARSLGVSHIPVREALNKLKGEGHLEWVANRGFFVPQLTLEDAEDIYHWRRVLEDEAVCYSVPHLTDGDVRELTQMFKKMQRAVDKEDAIRFHQVNREFHFLPIRRYCSERFVRLLDPLWDAASHYQSVLIQVEQRLHQLQDQHRDLLDGFTARDPEAVNRVMVGHRDATLQLMREVLAREDGSGDGQVGEPGQPASGG